VFDVLREEILESLAGFALEDHAIGQKAVAESVTGRGAGGPRDREPEEADGAALRIFSSAGRG
jgi:hypothetical protein